MSTIPKFQTVELFLLNCLTQLGIPSDMKRRVNPKNKTIGKLMAINNSIKKKGFIPPILDRLSIVNKYRVKDNRLTLKNDQAFR